MSLYAGLQKRAAEGRPLRVGLIGAGKFGAMYLAQVPKTPGVHLAAIADLSPANAAVNLERVGWASERFAAQSLDHALRLGTTHVGDDWQALVRHPAIDIVVECTGNPIAAVEHCLEAFRQRKNVVNVTVEADAFCGPLLARKAAEEGVVYSLDFGDQPALICDLGDWARAAGFGVVGAGRGDLIARARRPSHRLRHPLRSLRGVRRRYRIHPQLLQGIHGSYRCERPLCVSLQTLAPYRARSRNFGGISRTSRRSDRRGQLLQCRRGG